MWLFDQLVHAHIVTGTVGLISMWVPVIGRKGSARHKLWGKVFAYALLATGTIAIGISLCTLHSPLETHPFSDDAALVRGMFGWMMLYLATMTIMLAWYGLLCIRNKRHHERNRNPVNFILQFATFVTAANCMYQGYLIKQPLMMGISIVGLTAAVLNTHFILTDKPAMNEWLVQHTRGLVGAGISVYTAFLAFGAVNTLPAYAFNPVMWATPTVLGVSFLLYHQKKVMDMRKKVSARKTSMPPQPAVETAAGREPT
ncbi:MAG: hypothetical protein AAFN78_11200 [Pseudomonadota bacterium]